MRLVPTRLPDVVVLKSPVHGDSRGFFTEVFHSAKFAALDLPTDFAQDNHSRSSRLTLRGLHFQLTAPQGKLVRAVTGSIFDVAVDLRRSSSTFLQWAAVTLQAGDGRQLWIPPGFGHGFQVLSDSADVSYKCTTLYDAGSDRGVRWDDAEIGIEWPLSSEAPLLSAKDAAAPLARDAQLFT